MDAVTEPALVVERVPLAEIDVGDRLRLVDERRAKEIALSFDDTKQITPIEVGPKRPDGKRSLIAGAHRLRAAGILGWTHILATTFVGSADETRLREIDENLYRRELSPFDQSAFLAERLEVYKRMHPAPAAGKPKSGQVGRITFSKDVLERFGIAERTEA